MQPFPGNHGSQASQQDLQQRRRSKLRKQRHGPSAAMINAQQQQQQQQQQLLQRQQQQQRATMDHDTVMGGDSLTDIVRSDGEILRRRQSLPPTYLANIPQADSGRRISVVDFGSGNNGYRGYQFSGLATPSADAIHSGYPDMGQNISMAGATANFSPQNMLPDEFSALSPEMMGNMIAFSNMNVGQMSQQAAMQMFGSSTMQTTPFSQDGLDSLSNDYMDMSNDSNQISVRSTSGSAPTAMVMDSQDSEMMNTGQPFPNSNEPKQQSSLDVDTNMPTYQSSASPQQARMTLSTTPSFQSPVATMKSPVSIAEAAVTPTQESAPQQAAGPNPKEDKTIYSKSGFDMLRALWQVATRKNPQVNLGAVDLSCAFVVCDISMNDCPIIYVSDNFQNLTGYGRHEIVGQNCRFLQAPDGKVEAGTKREFVDNGAIYNLKRKIATGEEVQQSLINYRKGGKPFLNLLTMIPIPWDTPEIRYIIGFQIDLVECPDALASGAGGSKMQVNYLHSDIGQYIWNPPATSQWEPEAGQTLGVDDVSTLLQQFNPKGAPSDWHRQSWDKMLLENADDVIHVLSLKGLFLYLSPSAKRVLEYESSELVGHSLSGICHPSDIVPVTRELKDTTINTAVNLAFRIRRKVSGYTWFESYGSLFIEAGKGRKCIILVGRKRPVFALGRRDLEANGGVGDSELWTKLSTSGMLLFVSSNVRSLLDLQPEKLVGSSIQELMRKESRPEFGRAIEKARRGRMVTCKHEVQNRRGQVLQAHTTLYPGDAAEGEKPTFVLAQTKLLKASSRSSGAGASAKGSTTSSPKDGRSVAKLPNKTKEDDAGPFSAAGGGGIPLGSQESALASEDNMFEELQTTRCTSWQYELRQMERINRVLAEELHGLLSNKKKRKRRKGVGNFVRDCANCHTKSTPEWRRGPSGLRDLCNSCGLRWAKQTGRVSPRNSSRGGTNTPADAGSKQSNSPLHQSPLQNSVASAERSPDLKRSMSSNGVATPPLSTIQAMAKAPPSQPAMTNTTESGGPMPTIEE